MKRYLLLGGILVFVAINAYLFRGYLFPNVQPPDPSVSDSAFTTDEYAADQQGTSSGDTSASPAVSAGGRKQYGKPPQMSIDTKKAYTAVLKTSKGEMNVMLFASDAPVSVNNFIFLAREGFYDGTNFHRIINGFMVQGGDPKGDGTGGPGYRFADEPVTREYTRGTLAMANAGPDTNGSQFFIMHADNSLPKNYVIFGGIDSADSASLATLDAIAAVPVGQSVSGERSKPLETVTIEKVTILEK